MSRSPFLKGLMDSAQSENPEIALPKIKLSTFKYLIEYIYTDIVQSIRHMEITELYIPFYLKLKF